MSTKKNFGAVIKLKTISNFLGKGFFLALLSSQTQASDRLYEAIGERLSLMQEVALISSKIIFRFNQMKESRKVIDMANPSWVRPKNH